MFTNEYFSDRVSAHTGGLGGVSQMQTAADRGWGGGGGVGRVGSKITKNVRTSFKDGPLRFQVLQEDLKNSISKFRRPHKLANKLSCKARAEKTLHTK